MNTRSTPTSVNACRRHHPRRPAQAVRSPPTATRQPQAAALPLTFTPSSPLCVPLLPGSLPHSLTAHTTACSPHHLTRYKPTSTTKSSSHNMAVTLVVAVVVQKHTTPTLKQPPPQQQQTRCPLHARLLLRLQIRWAMLTLLRATWHPISLCSSRCIKLVSVVGQGIML